MKTLAENQALYEELGEEFDRLVNLHNPFDSEQNRQTFRAAWLSFLESHNVCDDQWLDETIRKARFNKREEAK